jgi:hypothetical protein
MTRQKKLTELRRIDADRLAEYVAKVVAQAPPISAVARARLSAVLGSADRRAA